MKGSSVEECVRKAEKLISDYGICLLLFDVKNSRSFNDRQDLQEKLQIMIKDLNRKFYGYFPENNLATPIREEKGFSFLFADGSWAGISLAKIIPEIIKYQEKNYPNIPLYWDVAKDGFDDKGVKIVR